MGTFPLLAAVAALVLADPPPSRPQARGGLKHIGIELHQDPDRYDPVPVEGNIEAFLKHLLEGAEQEEQFRHLLKKLQAENRVDGLDPEILRKLQGQFRNPKTAAQLQGLLSRFQSGKGLRPDDLEALQKMVTNLNLQRAFGPAAVGAPASTVEPPAEDPYTEWARDVFKRLDEGRAGDYLRESRAWQNAMQSMQNWAPGGASRPEWLTKLGDRWKLPDNWRSRLGELTSRLPSLPQMPRIRLSAPNIGRWNLNFGGGGPRLSVPSVGPPSVSDSLFWILALVLLVLMGWFFYRKMGSGKLADGRAANLGPWPVNPATVATRTQLIQAFDYLALLLCGEKARTWNHCAVAERLGAQASRKPAAVELAQLYELARYTPGDDLLAPEVQEAARRHLVALAGSAAA